jgi:hypothetical protein
MASVAELLADGVVEYLAAGSYSLSPSVRRRIVPLTSIVGIGTYPELYVWSLGAEQESEARGFSRLEYGVGVHVVAKLPRTDETAFNAATLDEVRPMLDFCQELLDYFQAGWPRPLSSYPGAVLMRMEADPIFVPSDLSSKRFFSSVINLVFRTWRDRT